MTTNTQAIATECYPCSLNQILAIAELTHLNDAQTKILFEKAMQYLLDTHGKGVLVQHLVRYVTDTVIDMLGKPHDFDPYLAIKSHSNEIARSYIPAFRQAIGAAVSPLETALKIAAAGNIIDFGAVEHANLDIGAELESIDERGFGIYNYDAFDQQLSKAQTLLYVCDNAGEIVLDKLFIEEIKRTYPAIEVTCAVRARPIINDALMDDALAVGLDEVATVITSGSVYPGTILEETTPEFQHLWDDADMIISKGQGNFETLLAVAPTKLFFILRIKCGMMARLSGTDEGNLVLMQGDAFQKRDRNG